MLLRLLKYFKLLLNYQCCFLANSRIRIFRGTIRKNTDTWKLCIDKRGLMSSLEHGTAGMTSLTSYILAWMKKCTVLFIATINFHFVQHVPGEIPLYKLHKNDMI